MIPILRKVMSGNRRKYPRVPLTLKIRLRGSDEEETIEATTRNLSASGMEVVLPTPIDVLTHLEVELKLPEEEESLQLKGRVVRAIPLNSLWGRLRKQLGKYVIGVNFTEIDLPTRERLIQYLQQATR